MLVDRFCDAIVACVVLWCEFWCPKECTQFCLLQTASMTDTSRSLKEGVVGMSVWPKNDSLPAPVCESNEGMFLIYKNLRIERDGNEYNQALR